jgi:phospholipid/cholesterol/gamma-HCH transport system substrate-binding protein
MRHERRLELRVGFFLVSALFLTLAVIWMLGSAQNLFKHRDLFFLNLPNADGISPGAKVTISGVNAGSVESLDLDRENRSVQIHLRISSHLDDTIRRDSYAEIITEGVLGDKLVAISAGNPSYPKLPPESVIPVHEESSIRTLLGKGDRLLSRLDTLSKDLDHLVLQSSDPIQELDSILGKADHGNGTLGGLINDPKLYDDVKSLIGESNDNRIVRNIVRKTIEDSQSHTQEQTDEKKNG